MGNWRHHWLTLLWAIAIAVLTLLPGDSMPEDSIWNIPYLDKVVHTCIFALLSFLMARGIIKQQESSPKFKNAFFLTFFIAVLYGALIEYLQNLIPGRSMELNDLIANSVGALLGLIACYFLLKLVSNRS